MKKRVFNPQVFLELICYAVFAFLMFYLIVTGKYQSYVTPRMVPYFYFTGGVMIIWAFAGLLRLFRPQHKTRAAHCLVLAIPSILLLLPHTSLNTTVLSSGFLGGNAYAGISMRNTSGNTNLNTSTNEQVTDNTDILQTDILPDEQVTDNTGIVETGSIDDGPVKEIDDASSTGTTIPDNSTMTPTEPSIFDTQSDVQDNIPEDQTAMSLPGLDVKNKKITISNDDFGIWMNEIYMNMAKYVGYTVVVTGFVFKDPEMMEPDEFASARLTMWCCAADVSPDGLFCKYDKASELEMNSWVTVEGTLYIEKREYDDQEYDNPQLSVIKITPAEEVEGYVYPY